MSNEMNTAYQDIALHATNTTTATTPPSIISQNDMPQNDTQQNDSPETDISQAFGRRDDNSEETSDEDSSINEEMDLAAVLQGGVVSDTSSDENWVANYKTENGRTYHSYSEGKYWGSNDLMAQDEELACHNLWFSTFGRHLICPTNRKLEQVLDLGTGTGLWASQIATDNPEAFVTGLDLSPIQPVYEAENVHFIVDDVEKEFACAKESQDLIHMRGLDGSIRNWSRLYAQCFRSLKPGGILEHAEYSHVFTSSDNSIPAEGPIAL